jgi:hypothetical protein
MKNNVSYALYLQSNFCGQRLVLKPRSLTDLPDFCHHYSEGCCPAIISTNMKNAISHNGYVLRNSNVSLDVIQNLKSTAETLLQFIIYHMFTMGLF